MPVEVRYSGQVVRVSQPEKQRVTAVSHDDGLIAVRSFVVSEESPAYEGEYTATPTWSMQSFGTRGFLMLNDFTVNSILKQEVSNEAGGLTLSI